MRGPRYPVMSMVFSDFFSNAKSGRHSGFQPCSISPAPQEPQKTAALWGLGIGEIDPENFPPPYLRRGDLRADGQVRVRDVGSHQR